MLVHLGKEVTALLGISGHLKADDYHMWGLITVLFIILIVYKLIKSFVYFWIIRPRDPQLYAEYRADNRAAMQANAIRQSGNQISNSIDRQTFMHYDDPF